jgi:hypothetical protein
MIKPLVSMVLMCVLSECAFADARTALTAQRSLIGWSERIADSEIAIDRAAIETEVDVKVELMSFGQNHALARFDTLRCRPPQVLAVQSFDLRCDPLAIVSVASRGCDHCRVDGHSPSRQDPGALAR